ncbi:MAG: hypothetical protein AAF585_11490, partial [Verrucomicrobiota bacterium]
GELESDIVGRWDWKGREWGISLHTVSEYRADGTYHAITKAKFLGTSEVVCEGVWRFDGEGNLRVELTKTTDPKNAPVGEVFLMKSVTITGDVLSYVYEGKKETEKRLK